MSFFRNFIDRPIQEELFNRIDSLNFVNSSQGALDSVKTSLQHQFVKSCWARTSVVLNKGEVISLNSNLDSNKNPINEPLNIKNGQPYRGKPGIVSISSNFKEYFIKTSTINFFVPDPNDFDLFKKQFLKFGRYMLVEFGWSLPYNLQLPTLSGDTILEVSNNLQNRVLKGKGNYNALVGVVTNYTFNQTKEGAYEGTIEISSMGRNVLGQTTSPDGKIDSFVGYVNEKLTKIEESEVSESDTLEVLEEREKKIFNNLRKTFVNFNAVIDSLNYVVEDYIEDSPEKPLDTTTYVTVNQGGRTTEIPITTKIKGRNNSAVNIGGKIFTKKDSNYGSHNYVTWGWFEDFILNSFFSFTSQNDKINFKTEFRSARESDSKLVNNLCKTHPQIQSLGFDSIILPGNTKKFNKLNYSDFEDTGISDKDFIKRNNSIRMREVVQVFDDYFPSFETDDKNGNTRGQIRNMVFNVEYLMQEFSGTTSIEKQINRFWQKVTNDYGGFWRFAVVEDETKDGRIMVTDLNIGVEDDRDVNTKISTKQDPTKVFKFPVYSKDSIVSDFQIQSENSSEMATLAVYGSNVDLENTSADTGKGYTALAMRALGSLDNLKVADSKGTNNSTKDNSYYDNLLDNLSNPVYGNFQEKNSSEGSSATYDDFGNPITINRNGGIVFDEVPEVIQNFQKIQDDLEEAVLNDKKYDVRISSIRQGYFWFDESNETVQIYSSASGRMYDEFKRTMLFLINKAPGQESNYSVVLPVVPIQLSLTIQGIGGIKIGDLFYIDYLPERYRKYCHFMVVSVDHDISTSGWTTKIDSRMIVDIPKLINDNQVSQLTKFEPIIVENSLFQKIKSIEDKYTEINDAIDKKRKDREDKLKRLKAAGTAADAFQASTAAAQDGNQAGANPFDNADPVPNQLDNQRE